LWIELVGSTAAFDVVKVDGPGLIILTTVVGGIIFGADVHGPSPPEPLLKESLRDMRVLERIDLPAVSRIAGIRPLLRIPSVFD
jgi:hypothetical protein